MKTIIKTLSCLCIAFVLVFSKASADNRLFLTSPAGGEQLHAQSVLKITWEMESPTNTLDILLWNGGQGTWQTIATNIPQSLQNYNWTVNSMFFGNEFRIKLRSRNSGAYSFTRGYFSILPPQPLLSETTTGNGNNVDVKIYPQPFGKEFAVESNSMIEKLTIFNVQGDVVLQRQGINSKNAKIDVSSLPSGSYVIYLKTDKETIVRNVIKE